MKAPLIQLALILSLTPYPSYSKSYRDPEVRREFVKEHPCPAKRENRCLYQVDHVVALVCGGRDVRENLAWLNVETHKLKSRDDVRRCRGTWYGWWARTWRFLRYGE